MKDKITFSDLSTPLKVAIVFAYVVGIIYSVFFVAGGIVAIMEGI